jgi:hypothetical protein
MQARSKREQYLHRLEEDKDEKEAILLQYIQKNQGETINKIAKKMEEMEVMSRLTTIKKIDELKDRKILRDKKEKHTYHSIYINEDAEFNKIFNTLSEIENFMDKFGEELHKIDKIHDTIRDMNMKGPSYKELMELVRNLQHGFTLPYYNILRTVVRLLFARIVSRIDSEEDAQILHAKNMKLVQKLNLQFWENAYLEENSLKELGKLISKYTHGKVVETDYFETYVKNTKSKNINLNLLDELMESLKKTFFPEI